MSKQREIRSLYRSGEKISHISKELGISRPTIRKIVNVKELTDKYVRSVQPYPKLEKYTERLESSKKKKNNIIFI